MERKSVRELRMARGLTREQLAVAVNTAYSNIVRIEQGHPPRVELAERIYQFFGIPVGSIDWDARPPKAEPAIAA